MKTCRSAPVGRSAPARARRIALLVGLALAATLEGRSPVAVAQDALSDDAALGRVVDREGVARRRPVLAQRWGPADERMRLAPGDWLETGARGANALALELSSGAKLVLGPGGLLEVNDAERVTLSRGELELVLPEGARLSVGGPRSTRVDVRGRALLRARDGELTRLDDEPRWLTGYRGNASTEALGSLLADIDGRNVPLTMGYHQVTVDVRDQIARTVIEESFVNHTHSVLEGVFYFPLPADASISGFGMWIGGELVEGEIVEKERAREIYETILRERRDPGLLEWTGGSLFKARVFPIGDEKRIRIAYTQVLPKRGDTYAYHYALRSDLLRQFPLERLRIQVDVRSSETLVEVASPSHDCRVQQGEHSARVEFEAAEFSPDRDFELRVRAVSPPGGVTAIPHRRGDDGYFLLLLSAPALAERAKPSEEPLELLLLADTSGSMWGEPRDNQIAFVEALLGSLGERDTFELATLDVETRFAAEGPQRSTAETREAALRFLEAREPLGWTDLDRAFAQVFERAGPRTAIVYVGDGASTAGDPDPAAFARRLARLYRGRGSVHAVVPGSGSEPLALEAMAALGGGSLRTIGGGTDPAATAFELLDELTLPAVKDLRLSFEGIEVAAVYPERLPNLPAGRQQLVLGRFDPRGGDLSGRVRVRGTLDGAPVEFEGEIALAAGEEGNDFVPRLWARRHLDHLLAQGASAEIRERVIALSQDFQIATPYTSFLVLESDADRERFGVEKRLRMRDGEAFFAEGRAAARHELVRQQMLAAKGWRKRLQARLLDALADLERSRTELLRAPELYDDGSSLLLGLGFIQEGGAGDKELASVDGHEWNESAADSDGAPGSDDLDDALAEDDDAYRETNDALSPAEEPASPALRESIGAERVKRIRTTGSDEMFLGRGERAQSRRVSGLLGGALTPGAWGDSFSRKREAYELHALGNLFPPVPAAPAAAETPDWPAEVRELLAALDRSAAIAAAAGGFELEVETIPLDARRRWAPGRARHWLSRGAWAQRIGDQWHWYDAGRRGVLTLGWDLGRTREAVAADADGWSEPLSWWFGRALSSYVGHSARLEELGDGRVRVMLTQLNAPEHALELILERERALLLETAWLQAGTAHSRTVYGDFREVGGAWWPGSVVTRDAGGRELSRTTLRVDAHAPERFAERLREALAVLDGALLLRESKPDVQAAKQAAREGRATLEQRFELLLHFAGTQRWKEAEPELAAFEDLAGDVRGREAVRLAYLQLARSGEALRLELLAAAERLAGGSREGELSMAGQMLAFAQGLEPGAEQLELLDALRPVYERHAGFPDAVWIWDQRRTAALDSMQRFEQAFALRADMARRYPYQVHVQTDYARALAQRGELDQALSWLSAVEDDHGPWQEYERGALRGARLDLLWNGYRLESLVETCEAWLREDAEAVDAGSDGRWLSALVFLDREEAARARVREWLAPAGESTLTAAQRSRLQAAVQHLLGQGYGLYRHGRLEDDRAEELALAARRLAHVDGPLDLAAQIATHYDFRESDAGRAFLDERMAELEAGVETLSAARLQAWVQWLRGAQVAPAAGVRGAQAWDAIFERVLARWAAAEEPAERAVLESVVLSFAPRELQLRLRRKILGAAADVMTRAQAAEALLIALLEGPWSAEIEEQAFGLLPALAPADELDAPTREAWIDRRVLALYELTSWLPRERARAAIDALPDVNSMPRRILRSESQRALREARLAAIARLAALEPTLVGSELAPWSSLERAWLQVKTRTDLEGARRAALEVLAAQVGLLEGRDGAEAGERAELREHVLVARSAATSTWLLAHAPEDERAAREAELIALLERGLAAGSENVDWRELIFVERVLIERTELLEGELEAWFGTGEDLRHVRWGVARAHVAAERGQLELAVSTLELVERLDELGHDDLRALAGLYTALDRPDAAREARLRSWGVLGEHALAERLQRESQIYQRSGDEPPPELDPEIAERLVALLRKSQGPAGRLWLLQQVYGPTKDFRLIECLPEGVLGHSSQAVYPFLRESGRIFELVQEEATLDRLHVHLSELRAASGSSADRRALALLEFAALQRAAAQAHGVERHLERALAALDAARREAWLEGEPLLMAEFLAAQGVLRPAALAEAQVRCLRELRGAARDPEARFAVSGHLARTLWELGRSDEALRTLGSALDALREAAGGRLPQQANDGLETLSGWLVSVRSWGAAEALWDAELAAGHPTAQRLWLDERRHGVYRDAVLADGELSLGRGRELQHAVTASFLRALEERTNEGHASHLVSVLCDLWTKGVEIPRLAQGCRQDSVDFAFARLPALLARYQYRGGQDIVGQVAWCLERVHGQRTELEFLTARAESEPRWLRLAQQDFWSLHSYRLADARAGAGPLEPLLEQRVLAVVLSALRDDLRTRRARSRAMYSNRMHEYWHEKRPDFLRTALEVLAERRDSGAGAAYVAQYLFFGLDAHDEAIAALQDAHRRKLLDIAARRQLCDCLQRRARWRESVAPLIELVQDQPEAVDNRVMLMRAWHHLERADDLQRTLDAAEAWLREHAAWNEQPIAALAAGCLSTRLFERSAALFGEAIALHVKTAPNRGVGDGVLSRYYREQSAAYSGLGRTDDAVDAAAGAIVSWGRSRDERNADLTRLEGVLAAAADLDAYVARLDAEVARTGLEIPIVRKALGRVLAAQGRYADAVVQLRLALAAQPDDAETSRELLGALDSSKQSDAAALAALEGARRAGHDLRLWNDLGRRLQRLDRAAEAERAYTNLAEVMPNESEGHALLAEVRQSQGRWAEAADAWSQVARVRSKEPTGYLGRARCLIELERFEEAGEVLATLEAGTWPRRFDRVRADVEQLRRRLPAAR